MRSAVSTYLNFKERNKKDKREFDVLDFALEKFHRFVSLQ